VVTISADAMSTRPGLTAIDDALREERRRLADALHDDALQQLAVARQDLLLLADGPDSGRAIEALRSLDRGIAAVRTVVRGSHEDVLAEVGLAAGVADVVDAVARRAQLTASCVVDELEPSRRDVVLLLSIVRELCANVAMHAAASHLDVRVLRDGEALLVEVRDDGRGIAAGAREARARAGHLGLVRLESQVAARGGELAVATSSRGTHVTVRLPA
jgi:two-component system, NarL family, sensor kinase